MMSVMAQLRWMQGTPVLRIQRPPHPLSQAVLTLGAAGCCRYYPR